MFSKEITLAYEDVSSYSGSGKKLIMPDDLWRNFSMDNFSVSLVSLLWFFLLLKPFSVL